MQSTSIKKMIAGVAAVATAAMGLALAAPAALAAPGDTPSSDWSDTETGTLNIYKREQNGTNNQHRGNGHEDSAAESSGKGVPNVAFTLTKVNGPSLDTPSATDWGKLANLSYDGTHILNGRSDTGWTLSNDRQTKSTDANGDVSFTGLKGLYYVTEDASNNPNVKSTSDPFFVVLPFPDSENTGKWLYTVDVYPKNDMNPKKKSSPNSALKAGDPIDWTVDTNIDRTNHEGNAITYTQYGISDPLSKYTSLDTDKDHGVSVYIRNSNGSRGTELAYGTDYTINYAATSPANADFPNTVRVNLTSTGLAALNAGTYPGLEFVIHVKTNRDQLVTDKMGHIDNTAIVNNNGTPESTPTSSKPVYGGLTFNKVDASDTNKKLSGATFELYRRQGTSCGNGPVAGQETMENDGGANNDGTITFSEVLVGTKTITLKSDNTVAREPADNTVTGNFCLVETKAPSGYILDKTPHAVTLTGGQVSDYNTAHNYITNTKTTGPKLPLTGAAGRLLLILGAIAILAAAAALYAVNKRRQNANANR